MSYTVKQTQKFSKWLNKLRDRQAKQHIFERLDNITTRGQFGEYKSLGDELYELKIRTGKGYRLYYTMQGETVVLLLLGGDKQNAKQQQIDITTAKLLREKLIEDDNEYNK